MANWLIKAKDEFPTRLVGLSRTTFVELIGQLEPTEHWSDPAVSTPNFKVLVPITATQAHWLCFFPRKESSNG